MYFKDLRNKKVKYLKFVMNIFNLLIRKLFSFSVE